MTQNLITSAFETVSTVDEGVMLLDVFQSFSARESIKRTIDKRTVEVIVFLFRVRGGQLNGGTIIFRLISIPVLVLPKHWRLGDVTIIYSENV